MELLLLIAFGFIGFICPVLSHFFDLKLYNKILLSNPDVNTRFSGTKTKPPI